MTGVKPGDIVCTRSGHASHHVLEESAVAPVPAHMDLKQAAWFGLAKITAMGARAAQYVPGDSVLIIGAGPIGQLTVRWAYAMGVETIIIVDPWANRMEAALAGGATAAIGKRVQDAAGDILAANGGKKPRIVIDATGHPDVFEAALPLAADRGRVVILGDTGTPSRQRLTSDIIVRGLTITGAHDGHEDAQWNARRIYQLFFNLVKSGRFRLNGLISHEFAGPDGAKAYELVNTQRETTLGVLFDWTKSET